MYFTTPGTRVSLVRERLRVEIPSGEGESASDQANEPQIKEVQLSDVERVLLHESISMTIPALGELMRRDIPVVLASGEGRILGLCQPPAPHSTARLAQYRRAGEKAFALSLAVNWVEAKILNSRRVLQRLSANRDDVEITPDLLALQQLAEAALKAASTETLRGYEGTAAGRYFECLAALFPPESPFERRSRLPPHNPANAVLSYAYTLLAGEAEAGLHAIGLDPTIGFYHEPEDRRASLALDIIEPFRAPLADAMAIDLFSHGILNPASHFTPANGGIYMNNEGKRRFFTGYERRMEREYNSEQIGTRTSLRRELQRQCQLVKKAIIEGEPFQPFLMN